MNWFDDPKGERGIDLVQLHDDLERNQMWNDADDWTPTNWAYSSDRDLRDINPEIGVNTSGSPKGAPPPEDLSAEELFNLCQPSYDKMYIQIGDSDYDGCYEYEGVVNGVHQWKPIEETEDCNKNSHYIAGNDPFRYATDNDLNVLEFSVIKYVTRHRRKNGKEDLEKARDVLDRLFEEYYGG